MGPDGLSEGEYDDEEPPATREVFMRHESGFIIYKDEVPELIATGKLSIESTAANGAGPSSASPSSSSSRKYRGIFIADSGFGSVKLVVAGAKVGIRSLPL